jgi:SAM-dependent methyltransferase
MKGTSVKLKNLTNDFYNQIPIEFDTTRKYQWLGWKKIIDYVCEQKITTKSILDVACGNGRFIETAKEFAKVGFFYLGIDNNSKLLQYAKDKYSTNIKTSDENILENIVFKNIDIYNNWELNQKFDCIVAMGITHHLVDKPSRLEFFKKIYSALSEDGFAVVTFWDFLSHSSLSKKIVNVNIEHINLFKDLGENDYILNWKKGKISYRYAHYFKNQEILKLFKDTKLKVIISYKADGQSGSSNLYYILKKN